jgi:outer membrane biosynthesis protein TonB
MRPPRHDAPGRGAIFASAAVHGVILLGAWWLSANVEPPAYYEVVQIQLFSEPPAAAEVEEAEPDPAPAAPEDLVVETPDPTPPAPEPEPEPLPAPVERPREPDPTPPSQPEPDPTPPPTPPEEARPAPTPDPAPESTTSGDDINVRMEGLRRDYPEYYQNIIVQIRRCFRPPSASGASTTIQFAIGRSGSVSDIRVVEPSGNITFDIEAEGAIECAGRGNRFGPLPEDLPYDRLPVQFVFSPG